MTAPVLWDRESLRRRRLVLRLRERFLLFRLGVRERLRLRLALRLRLRRKYHGENFANSFETSHCQDSFLAIQKVVLLFISRSGMRGAQCFHPFAYSKSEEVLQETATHLDTPNAYLPCCVSMEVGACVLVLMLSENVRGNLRVRSVAFAIGSICRFR